MYHLVLGGAVPRERRRRRIERVRLHADLTIERSGSGERESLGEQETCYGTVGSDRLAIRDRQLLCRTASTSSCADRRASSTLVQPPPARFDQALANTAQDGVFEENRAVPFCDPQGGRTTHMAP